MIIKDMVISDRAAIDSVRTKDENGYLRVAVSNITKEQVAPYLGSSIPYYKELKTMINIAEMFRPTPLGEPEKYYAGSQGLL